MRSDDLYVFGYDTEEKPIKVTLDESGYAKAYGSIDPSRVKISYRTREDVLEERINTLIKATSTLVGENEELKKRIAALEEANLRRAKEIDEITEGIMDFEERTITAETNIVKLINEKLDKA